MRGACFFFSSRRRHTRLQGDWSSDVCSSDVRELGHRGGASSPFAGKLGKRGYGGAALVGPEAQGVEAVSTLVKRLGRQSQERLDLLVRRGRVPQEDHVLLRRRTPVKPAQGKRRLDGVVDPLRDVSPAFGPGVAEELKQVPTWKCRESRQRLHIVPVEDQAHPQSRDGPKSRREEPGGLALNAFEAPLHAAAHIDQQDYIDSAGGKHRALLVKGACRGARQVAGRP